MKRGLVTPPLPFAEAERKPVLMERSIIRFPADCIRLKSHFFVVLRTPRDWDRGLWFGCLQPEPAGAALAERLFQLGQDRLQLARKRPRRIDDQKTGRGKRCAGALRRDAEFEPQAFARGG